MEGVKEEVVREVVDTFNEVTKKGDDLTWGKLLKGKRRKSTAFEMMFKKNILAAKKKAEEKNNRKMFKISDFRANVTGDDDTTLDIAAYRFEHGQHVYIK